MERVIVGCCNVVAEDGRYLFVCESKESARGRSNLPAGKPEPGEAKLIRGKHIEQALDDFEHGQRVPFDLIAVVPASPLPSL